MTTRSRRGVLGRLVMLAIVAVGVEACANPERERLKATTQASYDKATGRLTELTFDANRNGRVDTWTEMDGTRPVRSKIDSNEDGRIDRWEYYDAAGQLTHVGFSRKQGEAPDAWAYAAKDGKIARIEVSSVGDPAKIDRWEFFGAAAGQVRDGTDATGPLVRVEEDTNHDGRRDKWEHYEQGVVATAEFDENGDGRPDRRLTYRDTALVLIESAPDASGVYTRRLEPK